MTPPPAAPFRPAARRRKPAGAALIIALSFLLLLSAVVLALFSTAQSDRTNASAFATGQETLRLADAAVNLVQGQIRDATIQPRVGWASQPGMIRAFDTQGRVTAHKLYSSPEMVVANYGKTQIDAEFDQIRNWNTGAPNKSFNARYADLNAPAVVKRPKPGDPTQTISTPVFPIADPAAIGAVEGFSANTSVAGTVLGTGSDRRLPMPVSWLYVLKDGRMIAPSGGDATRATFSGPVVPTQSNPIVGRIAFWADDDTCKLNINTASEGGFWDTPRANTFSEQRLALSLPVQGEFQRIAGHPATTSLSPVLGALLPAPDPAPFITTGSFAASALRASEYAKALGYFRLTPRITGNASDLSSQFGLKRTAAGSTHPSVWPATGPDAPLTLNTKAAVDAFGLPFDTDRLYAVPDELLFAPDRSLNPGLTAPDVALRDFFLTAQSRAPETTLWGTPRLSLWPLNTTDSQGKRDRTVKDRLLAFCATIGSLPYYFDRVVGDGYETSNPGGAISPSSDISRPRNSRLLAYLQKLTSASIPGYGSSFTSKWGDPDKVIAQAVDTIRATNCDYVDFGAGTERVIYRYGARATNPRAEAVSSWGEVLDYAGKARGFVSPTTLPSGARGPGRSLTFTGFAVVIMPTMVRNTYSSNVTLSANVTWTGNQTCDGVSVVYDPPLPGNATFPATANPTSQQTLRARAFLLVQPYNATPGGANVAPGLQMEVSGALSVGGVSLITGATRFGAMPQERNYAMQTTALNNPQYLFFTCGAAVGYGSDSKDNVLTKIPAPAAGDRSPPPIRGSLSALDHFYPFVTPEFDVSSGSVSFGGGTLNITLKDWTGSSVLQTFTVTFPPAATLPAPQHMKTNGRHFEGFSGNMTVPSNAWDTAGAQLENTPGHYLSLWKRMRLSGDGNRFAQGIIRPGDLVLGVQITPGPPVHGDLRLVTLQPNVPANWFEPSPGYPLASAPAPYAGNNAAVTASQITGRFAHSLRNEYINLNQYAHTDQFFGKLAAPTVAVLNTSDILGATTFLSGLTVGPQTLPVASAGLTSGFPRAGLNAPGDWASGFGTYKDGAIFARPEAGIQTASLGGFFQDRNNVGYNVTAGSTFEPNRMIPSAGILGGVITPDNTGAPQPWQTLLARPDLPASAHPGAADPPDHLFLDNFWMPVVEPYAISEPLSTAGKVNLNSQLLPFTHITRETALAGALKPVMISALENSWAAGNAGYKFAKWNDNAVLNENVRRRLNLAETLKAFRETLSNGGFYRAATEVTTVPLVPEGFSHNTVASFWNPALRGLTSDTLREQPYTALLSRVTTKSNTYTVHYRVQALRQPPRPGRNWAEWDEQRDTVAGEYRGASTIERFLDPNAQNIPDYTEANLAGSYDPIDKWYRWRVVSQKQFAP